MQIFVFSDTGLRLAKFVDGKAEINSLFDKEELAFVLFKMMLDLVKVGGGAAYGGTLAVDPASEDIDSGEVA